MQQKTLWGERVPGAPYPFHVADLEKLPDDGYTYEIVEVAEVVSPSQYRPEMDAKAQLYLDRGVRLVWIIWPNRQEVDVWRPISPQAPIAILSLGDILDGLDVLPGFTCPLADLFN